MPADPEYSILLLGPPEIRHRDEPISVRRRQVRALFYLLAHDPAPVSREKLAYHFWPDRPDRSARRNLTRLLSAARAELGDTDLLDSRHGAVALRPKLVWSDCVAFEQMRTAQRRETLEAALALYRGPFLEGFSLSGSPAFSRWQDNLHREYERKYLALLQNLIDLCRDSGALAAAITYARQYLAIDELAEEMHQQLISLYAAAGDRAGAARQFEACTLILERELGVSPLPETRAAYQATLEKTTRPPIVARTWSVLPSLDLPLTGREAAWEALTGAYRRFQAGGMILISGEPGVGKSRLMQTFATSQSSLVLTGSNPPGAQGSAYTAVAQALRQALPHQDRWEGIRPIWLAEVGRLLPEMADHFPDLPRPVEVEPAEAQTRLFEGLSRCLLGLARGGPLLLCLDDLHWADQATLTWLATLPHRLAGSGAVILAAYRPAHAEALAALRQAFSRSGRLAELPLTRLTEDAVAQILAQLPQRPLALPALARRIHRATGGNTFFVLETVRVLLEDGRLDEPPVDLPLAPTVESAIRRRLERLSPLGRQVVETAAVLAPDLQVELLEETAGRSALEISQGMDELASRQLLVAGEEHRFGHELLRQVAYGEISPWRRRILHRRSARALERTEPGRERIPWATIAAHYERADQAADAVRCYEEAARAAHALYAHREAIGHLRRALDLAPVPGADAPLHRRLQEALGDSLAVAGEYAAAEEAYGTALTLVAGNQSLQWAILQRKMAETLIPQQRASAAETLYRQALARLDGSPSEATTAGWQATKLDILLGLLDALYFQNRPDAMAEMNRQTEALLEKAGTAEHKARYYARLNQMDFLQSRYQISERRLKHSRLALTHAQASGNLALIAREWFGYGFTLLWHDDLEEARAALQQALAMAEEAGLAWLRNQCLSYLSILLRFLGATTRMRSMLPLLAEASEQIGYANYRGVYQANSAWLNYRAGSTEDALRQARAALDLWSKSYYPFLWLAHWVLLALDLQEGRLPDAVAAARALLDPDQQRLRGQLPAVLEAAVGDWEGGQPAAARRALQRAVDLAADVGYL